MSLNTSTILLILLAFLFIVGVGVGLGRDDSSDSNGFSAWKERMAGFGALIPRGRATLDDVRRADPLNCVNSAEQRIIVPAGSICSLSLEPAGRARDLNVALLNGNPASVVITQPLNKDGDPLTARQDILPGQQVKLDLYSRQTKEDVIVLQILCGNGQAGSCVLALPDR